MNWIQDGLSLINQELFTQETGEQTLPSEYQDEQKKRSTPWSKTKDEYNALERTKNNLVHTRGIPGVVRIFAIHNRPYVIINQTAEDIIDYLKASSFWKIKKIEKGKKEILFGENNEMMAIICSYKGKFVITTKSSFKNILESSKEPTKSSFKNILKLDN